MDVTADESLPEKTTEKFRRLVFYIPGYDPFHPRRYRELYRSEGAAQAAISGYELSLTPRKGKGPYGWHVATAINGQSAEAEIEVLVWSDIVKSSMSGGIVATYVQLFRTAWAYIGSGALFRLMRLRKGPMIAALYPIVFLLAQLALALLAGWGVARGCFWVMERARNMVSVMAMDGAAPLSANVGLVVFSGIWIGVTWLVLSLFRAYDHKVFAYYLMHDYAYSAQAGGANPPELENRMQEFGAVIHRALNRRDIDEVLVVGHSSGAHLGVSILSDLIRQGLQEKRPDLGFLSLGQVVPMVSFLPQAKRLRADLAYLCERSELTWVDVTAPGDGCAFALCDPVAVSGVAPQGQRWPLILSAAFTQSLSTERWKALRWRFFRLHFQYLCAFDRPKDYDYFQITGGAQPLGLRFKGRAPSRSVIRRAENRFRSVA